MYYTGNRLAAIISATINAIFVYDGNSNRVQSTINGVTTYFVGSHYEKSGSTVTKYYFAGTSRIAMRKGGTLSYLLSDHLGSTSLTTNASGALISELRYKPWGEVRYLNGTTPTQYTYTGQYSNVSDFGLLFYNARWYDPALGRFAQADSIVPGGVQGWDRYAYVNNNPVRYTDPSGHAPCDQRNRDDGPQCFKSGWINNGSDVYWANKKYQERALSEMIGNSFSSPTFGFHLGNTTTMDAFYGGYYYEQTDYLFNLKTGTFYTTKTTGTGTYIGAINGAALEGYFGLTNVHGIPLSADSEKVAGLLAGPNIDFATDAGGDLIPEIEISGGQGYNVDINPNTGKPQITTAGLMYTNEMKVGLGVSVLPFPIDGGIQWGNSNTIVEKYRQIPWWLFR